MKTLLRLSLFVGLLPLSAVQIAAAEEDDIIIKAPVRPKAEQVDVVIKPMPESTAAAGAELGSLPGRRYGLLVGVNDYTFFSDLAYCGADISNLDDVLEHSGFDPRDLVVLRDGVSEHHLLPYRNNIVTQLKNLLDSVRENDLVLVAFSGHGVHLDGKSYLCPADAQLDRAAETMIPLDEVYELLQGCEASQKLLIVDACRNDPTPSGTRSPAGIEQTNEFTRSLQQQAPPRGTMLFNSCAPNQYSVEDPDFQSGVFMHYVIAGLRGEADADKDSKVSLFELYRYAEYETKTFVRRTRNLVQTPVLKGEVAGVYELAVVSDAKFEPKTIEPQPQPVVAKPIEQPTTSIAVTAPQPVVTPPVVDEAALTRAAVAANPLLKQGNQYFAEGKYNEAVNSFTNVIRVEENKGVVREAFKRRAAAYMAADAEGNVLKALADSQAAGQPGLLFPVRSNDAKVMDSARVAASLRSGQIVLLKSANGMWLEVGAVDGNDSIRGWLDKKYLSEPKPQVVVTQPPVNRPLPPQQPFPNPGGGYHPLPGNGNGNGGGGAGSAILRGIEREVIRQIFKK